MTNSDASTIPEPLRSHRHWDFPRRQDRYAGTGLSASIDTLSPIDRSVLVNFYRIMDRLMVLPAWESDDPIVQRNAVLEWSNENNWSQSWRGIAALGPESYILQDSDTRLRQVIHDLRGGPLTSLVMSVSMLLNNIETDPSYIWLLVRDVRKIARNCFPDLDPDRYQDDLGCQHHSIRLIAEKWGLARRGPGVEVYAEFDGNIANSCVEFSALDRVIYNLMNNALRESAPDSQPVQFYIFTNDEDMEPNDVRFWIRNTITHQNYEQLSLRFGDNLSDLFLTNFSTTGSGIGMQIVGDFVGQAYGVSTRRALDMRIVGARLSESYFDAWFHWPIVD